MKEKQELSERLVLMALRNFTCKIRIEDLKYEDFKDKELRKIKEKLTILSIKKLWNHKKFNFKVLRNRVLQYKRRKETTATTGKPSELTANTPHEDLKDRNSVSSSSFNSKEYDGLCEGDIEFLRTEKLRVKLRATAKRERIRLAKLSHVIRETHSCSLTPVLQVKALNPDEKPYYRTTNSSILKHTHPAAPRHSILTPKPIRPKLSSEASPIESRNYRMKSTPRAILPSHSRCIPALPRRTVRISLREHSLIHIMNNTISSTLKQRRIPPLL